MGHFIVDVIDSVKDYVELMQKIFDFGKVNLAASFLLSFFLNQYFSLRSNVQIKSLISGQLTGKKFEMLIDSMHGATGPYVSTILCDILGVESSGCMRYACVCAIGVLL